MSPWPDDEDAVKIEVWENANLVVTRLVKPSVDPVRDLPIIVMGKPCRRG